MPTIALVGDYSAEVPAHRAIPIALARARDAVGQSIDWQWVPTRALRDAARDLAGYAAIWVVPASPYENMPGALDAIRFARETRRPFLGTCGGFQHALIEYARNVCGLADADHGESNPAGNSLIVTRLACSLIDATGEIRFVGDSHMRAAYGQDSAQEQYRCSFGVNPDMRERLERGGLRFTGFDIDGTIRAAELPPAVHPFFVGTLFQPERAALRESTAPLVTAFVRNTIAASK